MEHADGGGGGGDFEPIAAMWLRAVEDDIFPLYFPLFLEDIVPPATGWTVEVGSGEGRVCRALAGAGHRTLGVELSPTLASHAAAAQPEAAFIRGDARALPLPDDCAGAVVTYCSLIDIEGMAEAAAEMARILRPGGRLCICVTHPLANAGTFVSEEAESTFQLTLPYLGARTTDVTFRRPTFTFSLRGWTYSIEEYSRALERGGLVLERIREPARPMATGKARRWQRVPNFLFLGARHA